MKIGIFDPYLDSLGGGERYVLTLAEHLSENHLVRIFWDEEEIKERIKERLAINLDKAEFYRNVFSKRLNLWQKLRMTSQYDLIFILSDGSLPTTLAKKNILHFQRPFTKIKTQSLTDRVKLSRYQKIICNSFFTKNYIDQEYRVNSSVVYPPVDVGQFKPQEKENLIVSVGRFSKDAGKKQKEMIIFFKKLHQILGGWELYLIGGLLEQDMAYFNEIKQLAKGFPVKLFPNEPFANLKKHYSQAKIYWHAAGFNEDEKNNPAGMEHFGISTVEAMASGCVPLVYDAGGQKEIVNDRVSGFLWQNEKELIDQTLAVAQDEDLRIKMAKEGIKRAEDFSREVFLRRMDEIIFS
ncbi:MAG: glycosyltransferase family 4 protein [Patescibacteria group bacterium]|nr:glycosyltransferase family 4 protein [Patescibacteria group bacterium]MCL5095186.1 glycosyltransferase family 4 protein [Patescibacteria group bacterium]